MPDLSTLGIVLFACVLLYFLYLQNKRNTNNRLESAVTTLIDAIYRDIYHRLLAEYGPDQASRLAGSVTNNIFGFAPPNDEAAQFMKEHKGRIQQETGQLAEDGQVRTLAAEAIRVMLRPDWRGPVRPQGGQERALNLGFVVPGEKPMPIAQFLSQVAKYHRRMVKLGEEG